MEVRSFKFPQMVTIYLLKEHRRKFTEMKLNVENKIFNEN